MLDTTVSPDTTRISQELLAVPSGDTISYEYLSNVLGRSVQSTKGYNTLSSARRLLLRDHGIAFETERGVGLRRMPPDEAHRIGSQQRQHIRRTSRRAVRDMSNVASRSNGLPEETKRKLSVEIAVHGLIAHVSKDRVAETVPENHEGQPTPVAVTARNLVNSFSS